MYDFVQVSVQSGPRNQLKLRLTRPSDGFFAFKGNAKDSSKITPHINKHFVLGRRQNDLIDQGSQDLGCLQSFRFGFILQRGGLVCLNSFGRFVKWISASIMPPPSLVPAR
ncbi:MAG: hypothetical protein KJ755_11090 [Alphaproteobacteria bacterium]|nr:hypothetical protein [Alphaproteobacteria bacterium]